MFIAGFHKCHYSAVLVSKPAEVIKGAHGDGHVGGHHEIS